MSERPSNTSTTPTDPTPSPDELASRYGDVYRKRDRIELTPQRFERGIERGDDGSWGAGALVVADSRGLFVREGDSWFLPGGRVESNESIEAAARREVTEETGVVVELTDLGAIAEQTFVHPEDERSYEFFFATFCAVPRSSTRDDPTDTAPVHPNDNAAIHLNDEPPTHTNDTAPTYSNDTPQTRPGAVDEVSWFETVPEDTFDRALVRRLFETYV